ncbi:hypothetical protein GTV15_12825 [Streptomyces sp. SID7803]|nr:hypothetical protein [Streptomyces sp. SID7803]
MAWQEKQFGLYKAMIDLHDGGLIRIVHPANGERPDLMEATEAGHAALNFGPRQAGPVGPATMSSDQPAWS